MEGTLSLSLSLSLSLFLYIYIYIYKIEVDAYTYSIKNIHRHTQIECGKTHINRLAWPWAYLFSDWHKPKSMKSTVQLKSVCFLYFQALCSNICLRFYNNSNLLCCNFLWLLIYLNNDHCIIFFLKGKGSLHYLISSFES